MQIRNKRKSKIKCMPHNPDGPWESWQQGFLLTGWGFAKCWALQMCWACTGETQSQNQDNDSIVRVRSIWGDLSRDFSWFLSLKSGGRGPDNRSDVKGDRINRSLESLDQRFQSWVCLRITYKVCSNTDCQVPDSVDLDQAWEDASLISLVMPMFLAQGPHLWERLLSEMGVDGRGKFSEVHQLLELGGSWWDQRSRGWVIAGLFRKVSNQDHLQRHSSPERKEGD